MALINLIESLLAFNKGHLPLPPTVHVLLHMLTINMQSKNSTCLAPSPTNHPYMCILSFSKGKESQAQSVFSLSIFSSDSTLDGSRLLPLICTGYKWSPNGLMTMKTKPKNMWHLRSPPIWTLQKKAGVPREGRYFPPSSTKHRMMSWFAERQHCTSPTEFQTHIKSVLASFYGTTPHKDM